MVVIETTTIGGPHGLTLPRIINGLWQLADGHGAAVDVEAAAAAVQTYVAAGFGTFDCADREYRGAGWSLERTGMATGRDE